LELALFDKIFKFEALSDLYSFGDLMIGDSPGLHILFSDGLIRIGGGSSISAVLVKVSSVCEVENSVSSALGLVLLSFLL
jgi:hypothetical protein